MPDPIYPFTDNSYTVLHYTKFWVRTDGAPIWIDARFPNNQENRSL